MDEVLRHGGEAAARLSEDRRLRTQTLVKDTRGWSVGVLKVQRYSSIFTPGSFVGTMKQDAPGVAVLVPPVRAKPCRGWPRMPVFHIFSPLMR